MISSQFRSIMLRVVTPFISLTSVALLSVGLFIPATTFAATFNVGTGETYSTIQSAIDAASNGDTIVVDAGTYTENVNVDKSVIIEGQPGAILNVADGASSNGFSVSANNVTIEGFTIQGPATTSYTTYAWGSNVTRGVVIADSVTGFTITNDVITGLRNDILINGHDSTGSVTDNTIDNSKSGISIQYTDGTGITITGNTQGQFGNDWGMNLHLNGHLDQNGDIVGSNNPPIAATAPTSAQQVISSDSTNNANWSVQDQGYTSENRTSAVVSTTGTATGQGDPLGPINSIQTAVNDVVPGGTVTVQAGIYSGDLEIATPNLTLEGQGNVILNLAGGYGISLDNGAGVPTAPGFTFEGFTINASPTTTYAFKAYDADGLTLTNDTFNGGAGNTGGGVDINTTNNVTFNNVTSTGFYKNGFADTSAYESTDTGGNNITFNDITASDNGWDGIAFYTAGSAGGSASITGVQFTGTNTVSDNGAGANLTQGGIFIEGDSDANLGVGKTPAYTVTTDGKTLDLADVAFNGNSTNDIINYQTAPVNALSATFENLTGNQMTSAQQTAQNAKIYDQLDNSELGLVTYYTPAPNAPEVITDAATNVTSSDATLNGMNGDNAATQESFWVSTSTIDTSSSNIPAGVYSTPVLSPATANAPLSDQLSLVTTNGITTGGVNQNMPAITPGTTYYYVAWALVDGTWYPGQVMQVTTSLAAPILVSPTNNSTTTDPAFSDTWDPVTGAAAYEYQTSNDGVASNGVLSDIIYADTSTTSPSVYDIEPTLVTRSNNAGTPPGNYYWQVRAVDANGNPGAWSQIFEVTYTPAVVTPPAPLATPTGLSFTDPTEECGGITNSPTITTNWDAVPDATGYTYWVTTPGVNNASNPFTTPDSTNSQAGDFNQGDGVYTFKVNATGPGGPSDYSDTCSITYDSTNPTVSVTPDTTNPLSGTVTFDITINDANPATSTNSSIYVYLYNDGGTQKHQGAKVDLSSGKGTFQVDTTQLDNGAATLDVGRLEDAAGNFSGAADNYFSGYTIDNTVATPPSPTPSVPTLETPANATTLNTNSFNFTWDASTGGTAPLSYQFQATQDPTEVSGVLTNNLWASTTPTNSIVSSGAPDGTWYWQVRAEDADNNFSAWSPIWSVTLSTGGSVTPPAVTAPTATFNFPTPGPSATSFTVQYSEAVDPIEAANAANYSLENWPGDAGSGPLTGNATVVYDTTTHIATVTFTNPGWYLSPEQEYEVTGVYDVTDTADISPDPTIGYTTPLAAPTAPGAPTTTTPTTSTTQVWTWTPATDPPGDATASGVASYEYSVLDSTNATTTEWTNIGNVTTVTTSLPVGTYTLQVRAIDNAGNVGPASTGTVEVDAVGSTPSDVLVAPTPVYPADNVTITSATLDHVGWTAVTDTNTPITYNYEISNSSATNPDGSFATPVYAQQGLTSPEILTPGTAEGTYYWHAQAEDSTASTSPWSVTSSFTIDNENGGTNGGGTPPAGPDASSFSTNIAENAVDAPITLSTPDAGTPIYAIVTSPSHGTLSAVSGSSVSYTPDQNYTGADSFTYDASNGNGTGATGTVTITVTQGTAITPTAAPQTVSSTADAPVTITLGATDPEAGDTFTFATSSSPSSGTLSAINGSSVTYTPNADSSGQDSFNFTASDSTSTSSPATITINVTAPAPVVTSTVTPSFTGGSFGGFSGGGTIHTNSGGSHGGNGNGSTGGSTSGGSVLGASTYNFAVNFGYGTKDEDVTQLQLILIADGYLKISAPTGYFGSATRAAVKEYQSANNIYPVSGYVGPITRSLLNEGTVPSTTG